MNAKKRQRCLGALQRRSHDVLVWERMISNGKAEDKESYKAKVDRAKAEVAILQTKLGVYDAQR